MRLLYYLPSGHRTESHIPHLSLSLPVFLLCCLPTSARSLFPSYSFTSLPPILPSLWHSCLLFFFLIPTSLSLLLSELRTVPLPLCRVHLLLSCLPFLSSSPLSLSLSLLLLLSGCVFLYFTLLFSRRFMPFTWEPFYPSLTAFSSAVPT